MVVKLTTYQQHRGWDTGRVTRLSGAVSLFLVSFLSVKSIWLAFNITTDTLPKSSQFSYDAPSFHLATGFVEPARLLNETIFNLSPERFAPYAKARYLSRPRLAEIGPEGEGEQKVLGKVRQGIERSREERLRKQKAGIRLPKILCMVYTYEARHNNLRAIVDTWGRECDGFFAASNKIDDSIGAIELTQQGTESYGNMWQKVRSMWLYAYDHYLDQYDYFYICGDDTYLLVENLRAYLAGDEIDRLLHGFLDQIAMRYPEAQKWKTQRPRPLLIGQPQWRGRKSRVFPAGGNGYVLNRAAVELYGQQGRPHLENLTDSREDVFMGEFLGSVGAPVVNTQDQHGGWRFFGECAQDTYDFDGYKSPTQPKHLESIFGIKTLRGMDSFSEQLVSFHLKNCVASAEDVMYRYHSLLNISSFNESGLK
jgi:glycoprotein-N-acetylgalactosamine 3-beta-galactosyltransferase